MAGFSDITVLNSHLLRLGYQSIHGVMPVLFGQPGGELAVESLRRALFGELPDRAQAAPYPLNRPGHGHRRAGGRQPELCCTPAPARRRRPASRAASCSMEDLDEYLYHLDRMLLHLHRSGRLAGLAGLGGGPFFAAKRQRRALRPDGIQEIIDHYAAHYDCARWATASGRPRAG
ncbi:MAG: hypothetical protein WKG07_38430 [Hymenobacter sp.]